MTNEAPEANTETLDPKELARHLMVAAARFAGASLQAYTAQYPEQSAMLANSAGALFVRVQGILTASPRASLVAPTEDGEAEIAWVNLAQPNPMNPHALN